MASRDLATLHSAFQQRARAFVAACEVDQLDVLIYCTRRSMEEQALLYSYGRTVVNPNGGVTAARPLGSRVTNAQPGQSAHNYGLAFDGVPLLNGKPAWRTTGSEGKLWMHYGELARYCSLEWAGDWTTFREYPHCQMPEWRTYI